MSRKALVLSSGGVDSTTCLGIAVSKLGAENVVSASVYYGQKHNKELECASKVAEHYGVKHYTLDLSAAFKWSNCSLLKDSSQEIEHASYSDQISRAENGMVSTYVPFRNGTMLSAIATLAASIFPDDEVEIYIGAHGDDAAGNAYADCSLNFINAMSEAISLGTYGNVSIVAPFAGKSKSEVVKTGLSLSVPYRLTWSCYEGGEKACGTCGTCIDRLKAFEANGVKDPIEYCCEFNSDEVSPSKHGGMYYVSKRMEIAGAHKLNLPYESRCNNVHGHNWIVTVHCKSSELVNGMIIDFKHIKNIIHGKLDHHYINDVVPVMPTAENIARWILERINEAANKDICYKVEVQESEGNTAVYEVM